MIQSMTGFANKTFIITRDDNKANVSMSVKTLNSRFFEANCKLPGALSHLETHIIKQLKRKLHRGYVYFVIHVDNSGIFKGNINPALNVIENYKHALETVKEKVHITGEITIEQILQLPNIFVVEDQPLDDETKKIIFATLDELVARVLGVRTQEGEQLKVDLLKRLDEMEKEITIIEKESKQQVEDQKEKINALLEEIGDDESNFAETRKNALYAFLDKIDVHEEIVRFQSHLKTLRTFLTSDQLEKGKRIDFTLQELAREINTIAAKCCHASIGSHAINIKVEIEKAREQAQNIV